MRNKEMFKKMSVKCVTAIMIAAMSMSPVAATLAFPMTVYAQDNNPQNGETAIEHGEYMECNEGTVTKNEGALDINNGKVNENAGPDENGIPASINSNSGEVVVNNGDIGKLDEGNNPVPNSGNFGTVDNNNGTIYYNDEKGSVNTNCGATSGTSRIVNSDMATNIYPLAEHGGNILINEGTVTDNSGTIGSGKKYADGKSPEVNKSHGEGNHGMVEKNYGIIYYNASDGTIEKNLSTGLVIENSGIINTNSNFRNRNSEKTYYGRVMYNYGEIINNFGVIDENEAGGEVGGNSGKIKINEGGVATNLVDGIINYNKNSVNINKGKIVDNNNTVRTNQGETENNHLKGIIISNTATGTIKVNRGKVGAEDANGGITGNLGVIKYNSAGVVLNLAGGIVEKNGGTVYNYGGTVTDKANGTEYFSVKITNSNSTSNSSGLTQAYNQDWLGQMGTTVSTATITITPASGYKITNVSGFGDNVTATQNSDGTWTLTISSGANTDINVSSELLVDPSKIKIEVEPDGDNQGDPSGQNQDASNPAVTTPAIDTSATALATATWDGATIKIGETTVTVSALAAQDCAGLASTAVTQAELTVVYESIFASTIAANGRSVADARAEALRIATSLAEYITKDLPTNYTPAEAATYKAAYMDAFLKAIASGKTLKKAHNAALSASRTKMAQALLDQLNNAHTEGETVGIETSVTPAATQSPVVGEAADPAAAQMIAQAQQAMQDAASLANGL